MMDYTFEMFRSSISGLASDVEDKMLHDGCQYDYIVGITRGGLVPAVFLSHTLRIPMISVNWSTRDSGVRTLDQSTVNIVRNKKILIVEDIVDSGKTLSELIDSLADVCDINIAALIYNRSQPIVPDFYDVEIDREQNTHWINFFWEK